MGMGYCIAGNSERRNLKIVIPEFKIFDRFQLYNRSEAGRARDRRYNKTEKAKERIRRYRKRKRNAKNKNT